MKSIKDVSWHQCQIVIEFTNGYLRIGNDPEQEKNYKMISLDSILNVFDKSNFKQYRSLSKEELTSFQIIILNAYFFQMDKVEDFKVKEYSIESIEDEVELIVQIRVHLRSISEFIDSYEELREASTY
jgi:hypothetical protein